MMSKKELPVLTFAPPYRKMHRWFTPKPTLPPLVSQRDDALKTTLIKDLVVPWCIKEKYIIVNDTTPVMYVSKDPRDPRHLVNTAMFGNLTDVDYLNMFIEATQDIDTDPVTASACRLGMLVGSLYDEEFVDVLINMLYRSTYAMSYNDIKIPFDEIHVRYPHLWVFMLIQTAVHTTCVTP